MFNSNARPAVPAQTAPNGAGQHPLGALAQQEAARPLSADVVTVRLAAPLKTHRGDVMEIALRQPVLTDYIEIGDIDTFVASGVDAAGQPTGMEAKTSHQALMAYAVRLSGHDTHVLGRLHPGDAGNLIRAVRLMVLPFSRGNSSSGSMSSSST